MSISCSTIRWGYRPCCWIGMSQVVYKTYAGASLLCEGKHCATCWYPTRRSSDDLTEIVYAIGAGDRLVGDTTYCDYPPAAKKIEKVGDTLHPSIERIIALRPQLVLVSTASQLEAFTKQLAEHHIAVYVTDPHNLEGVF